MTNTTADNNVGINFQPMPKRFRVWDTEEKKFLGDQDWVILPTQPDCGATLTYDSTLLYSADQQVIDWADADLITGRYLICQSTNLFDKKGKEIFEGDIVYDETHERYAPVSYIDGMVVVKIEENEKYYISQHLNDIEVVGNIWQNPELLET